MTTAEARRRGLLVPGLSKVLATVPAELPKRIRKRRPAEKPAVPLCFSAAGLPAPEMEYRFCKRRWRFDFAWVSHRLALEIEGGIWLSGGGRHNRGKGFISDLRKYAEAVILGWVVIRVTPQMIKSGEATVILRRFFDARDTMRAAGERR